MKQFTCCGLKEKDMLFRWHTFVNGTKHIVCHCPNCGKHLGHIPQVEPYISLVEGIYVPTPKKPTDSKYGDMVAMLKYILDIPDIEKAIGNLTYEKARKLL